MHRIKRITATVKKVFCIAKEEFSHFLFSPKILLVLFTVVFLCENVLSTTIDLCKETGFRLTAFEPFILICSNGVNAMIIPMMFLVLISDFPSSQGSNYFHIIRMSRFAWLAGEFVFALCSALFYVLALFTGVLIYMRNFIDFSGGWSSYMTEFRASNPLLYSQNLTQFLEAGTVAHGSPLTIMLHTLAFIMLYMMTLALVLLLMRMASTKLLGMIITISITIISGAATLIEGNLKWFFPLPHAIYGLHFNSIFAEPYMELSSSYLYFSFFIVIFIIINSVLVRRFRIGDEG